MRKKRIWFLLLPVFCLWICLCLTGCNAGAEAEEEGGELVWAEEQDFPGQDREETGAAGEISPVFLDPKEAGWYNEVSWENGGEHYESKRGFDGDIKPSVEIWHRLFFKGSV